MKVIAAINADGNIDFETSRADKLRYQALTMGGQCLYGRTTWETLPGIAKRGRTSIIATYDRIKTFAAPVEVPFGRYLWSQPGEQYDKRGSLWICGGRQLYQHALTVGWDKVTHLYLSLFQQEHGGSLLFPMPNRDSFNVLCSQDHGDHQFEILERKHG